MHVARCRCAPAPPPLRCCPAARRPRVAAAASASGEDAAAQLRTPLVDALRLRAADGAAPFHVPGHQARCNNMRDVTCTIA